MDKLDVRIVKLESMTVASAYGFGKEPESMAGRKLSAWAKPKGFYDHPSPSPGSPNYSYEIWMKVDDDTQPEGEIKIKHFSGGLYAMTRFTGLSRIGAVWKQLVAWRQASRFKCGHHQCLEHLLNRFEPDPDKYTFDLYLAIDA